jgi:hypothetical protein
MAAGNASPKIVKEVRAFLDEGIRASMSGDTSVISRQLADSYIVTHSSNTVHSKADEIKSLTEMSERMAAMPNRPKFTIDIEDLRVFAYDKVIVANYIGVYRSEFQGRTFTQRTRFTETFIKRKGKLIMVASQELEIPNERVAVKLDQQQMDAIVGVYEATSRRKRKHLFPQRLAVNLDIRAGRRRQCYTNRDSHAGQPHLDKKENQITGKE